MKKTKIFKRSLIIFVCSIALVCCQREQGPGEINGGGELTDETTRAADVINSQEMGTPETEISTKEPF